MKQKILYLILISGILVSNWSCEKESPAWFEGWKYVLLDGNTMQPIFDSASSIYHPDNVQIIFAENDTDTLGSRFLISIEPYGHFDKIYAEVIK